MRMPAAQTLLLFAHTIDTNGSCSKIICDSWLCLELPHPESGMVVLKKACRLRGLWNKLLDQRLQAVAKNLDNEVNKTQRDALNEELEKELWLDLANFMNSEIYYTIKRLLPADLSSNRLYVGKPVVESEMRRIQLCKNPFSADFECQPNVTKGGWHVTEHVTFDW